MEAGRFIALHKSQYPLSLLSHLSAMVVAVQRRVCEGIGAVEVERGHNLKRSLDWRQEDLGCRMASEL